MVKLLSTPIRPFTLSSETKQELQFQANKLWQGIKIGAGVALLTTIPCIIAATGH